MVEICIDALCRMFLSNENKSDIIIKVKMVKKFKMKFLFKLFKFQYKWPRVNQIGW